MLTPNLAGTPIPTLGTVLLFQCIRPMLLLPTPSSFMLVKWFGQPLTAGSSVRRGKGRRILKLDSYAEDQYISKVPVYSAKV
jgi:hypothetical protein